MPDLDNMPAADDDEEPPSIPYNRSGTQIFEQRLAPVVDLDGRQDEEELPPNIPYARSGTQLFTAAVLGDQGSNLTEGLGGEHEAKGAKTLFERPQLRKESAEDETDSLEDWIEFFGDLIFVACLFKSGNVAKHCGTGRTLGIIQVNVMVWSVLWRLTRYINAIHSTDIFRIALMSLSLVGAFAMVLYVNDGAGEDCTMSSFYVQGFAFGYILSCVSITLLWGVVFVTMPETRGFLWRSMLSTFLAGVVVYATWATAETHAPDHTEAPHVFSDPPAEDGVDRSLVTNPSYVIAGMALATLIDLLPELVTLVQLACGIAAQSRWFLIHISHHMSRQGMVVSISLGEAVLGLLVEEYEPWMAPNIWTFQLLAFVIVMSLAFLHFNSVPHEIEHSVMRQSAKWAGRRELFYWALYPALFCVGIGLKLQLETLKSNLTSEPHEPHVLEGRRLAGMNEEWNELLVVAWTGVSLMLAQLLLLGIEVAQRREEMWGTSQDRMKFIFQVWLAILQGAYFVFCWASGHTENLIFTDCIIHAVLLQPAAFLNLRLTKMEEEQELALEERDDALELSANVR